MPHIHTVEWVKGNIQPVLNVLGGEIFGGFVRDYIVGGAFKDVDINYPHSYSEQNVETFRNTLQYFIGSDYQVKYVDTREAYDDEGRRKVLRSKFVIVSVYFLDDLEVDLIWDGRADEILDVDIHALYLDRNWTVKIYDQPQYRNALVNATLRQFVVLDASPRRIEKLIKKGYHQFTEGYLGGLWEKVDDPVRLEEYRNPLYVDADFFSRLKIGTPLFVELDEEDRPHLTNSASSCICEVVQIEEWKFKDYEAKRALILFPKGLGFPLVPSQYVSAFETAQCDGYYVRMRGKDGTQSC